MELVLKLNKKQLKTFTDLANTLNIKHYILSQDKEDEALLNAMQQGELAVLNDEEVAEFENWLKE
ncbi:MAG TPA: hypothetical protein VK872_17500 [Draconibacterium sp.]|jgi:hypothetical protein|nr:hypothetical protein [Draconibacterium sp.]